MQHGIMELTAEDLPMRVRLNLPDGIKEYILLKTKQGKLLLNKRIEPQVNSE